MGVGAGCSVMETAVCRRMRTRERTRRADLLHWWWSLLELVEDVEGAGEQLATATATGAICVPRRWTHWA